MVKKKKKRFNKSHSKHKKFFKKSRPVLKKTPVEVTVNGLVPTEVEKDKKESTTTFSKKLEEVISENQTKGLFGGKIILLNPPLGYTKEEWKTYFKNFWKAVNRFLLIVLFIAAVVGIIISIEYFSHLRVFPRVTLAGENYGFATEQEAKQHLHNQINFLNSQKIAFQIDQKIIEISNQELGIKYDFDNSFAELPIFHMRKDSFWGLILAGFKDQNRSLAYQFDPEKVYGIVEAKFGLTEKRAKNAGFYFDEKKKLQIKAEQSGVMIDPNRFAQQMEEALAQGKMMANLSVIEENPKVKISDLEKYKDDLQLKIESPISLKYGENTWKLMPKNHLENITFDKVNDQVFITFTQGIITDFLQKEVFDHFEIPVSDLKISYDAKTGKAVFDGKAKNGLLVDRKMFLENLNLTINSLDPDLEIPTTEIKANIEIAKDLQDMGIKELISTGHTAFAGSPTNRRFNIKVGMSKFDGLIIKPGETFSFNDYLGPVDGSTGYKLELVIKAEGTVPEFGGGVCQVSSTMFKAALLAGFPIIERAPHSYAVGYYAQIDGYGLDSTIYPGVRDLKFINDSGNNILIQTFVDGDHAYINFFGTSDGRVTKLENYWRGNFRSAGGTQEIPTTTLPAGSRKQIESAHGGFDAKWDRVIYRDGLEVARDKISSAYRATSNRILVGQ